MTQQLINSSHIIANEHRFAEDLTNLLAMIGRGWRYLAVSVLVCMTIAIFFAARIKPVYKGTARLLILQQGGRPLNLAGGSDPFQSSDMSTDYLPTHIMIIRSPLIVEKAVELSKVPNLSVAEVINRLTVVRPDIAAKILEITYQDDSRKGGAHRRRGDEELQDLPGDELPEEHD